MTVWSQEQIKTAADRAEARARGGENEEWTQAFDQSVETERRERNLAIIEAEIERLALLPELAYQLEREAAAERLRLSRSVLDKHVKARRPRKAAKEFSPIFDPDTLADSAGHIIQCQKILDLFAKDFSKVIAGEAVNGKLLYLVATSRLFDRPMNAAIKGTSAGGKSEIRKHTLAFFPPEDVVGFTSLSERALIYYEGDFSHRILSMGEAAAAEEQSFQDYLLRELMSESRIRHAAAQKVGGEIMTVLIEKEGPVAFLVTTTKNKLHPENETRMLSLEIDDSEKQTKNVLNKVAQAALHDTAPIDYKPWQDFQRWLAAGERRVVVPFATAMVELIPPVAVRLRRDVGQVLAAIQTHALLHRDQRGRDEAGRIIADIAHDYDTARTLLNAIIAEGSGVAVKPAITATIEAVTKATIGMADDQGVDAKVVAKLLKLDRSATWRRLSAACDEGYVCNLEQRRRMPGKYRVTGQKVEPVAILPATAKLAEVFASHTPPESVHSCNRDEIAETSLEDNECKDECTRVHECSSVQTGLALDNPMNGNGKSPPVARVHGFSGGYEEEECAVDSAAAIEPSLNDDLPDFDQDLPLVCEHCGGPATPTSSVQLCSVDGEECCLHPDCQTDWLGSQRGNGATKFRSDVEDAHEELRLRERAEDDLIIPPILDRRGEVCSHCGQPGGTEWNYSGLKVRLHDRCQYRWIDDYEASSNGSTVGSS